MAEYIDRSVAIARLTRLEVTDSNATMADAKRVLADIPAADAVPVVHGRWLWETKGLYPKPLCRKCSYEPYRASNHISDLPKFCPNCGAKMEE